MPKRKKWYLLLILMLVFSAMLACDRGDLFIKKIQCEAKGYIWQQVYNEEEGEYYYSCNPPPLPTPTRDVNTITGCMVSELDYSWAHENFRSSSGTGGVTCNAKFIFRNNSNEPVIAVMKTAWDNNAMNDEGWHTYSVPAGGEWETPVSRTFYNDGVTTFDHVLRLLVIRDIPACRRYVLTDDPTAQALWEEKAIFIDLIPCP